jgi:hypothetical protein
LFAKKKGSYTSCLRMVRSETVSYEMLLLHGEPDLMGDANDSLDRYKE